MITYQNLSKFIEKYFNGYKINIKNNYLVITMGKHIPYHITIFKDQWDDYQNITGMSYHLFHISNNEKNNRCSTYFWVDKNDYHIKKIPEKYFKYEQENYNFYASTRKPCYIDDIIVILREFQKILQKVFDYYFSQVIL